MLEIMNYDINDGVRLYANREKRICLCFNELLVYYNIHYYTSLLNIKTGKIIEIKEFFSCFESISDDTFVGVKQITGEVYFMNSNLKIIDKIKLPSTTIQGVFCPSKDILCFVDLDYIFIYSCNSKQLFTLTHVKVTNKNCYERFYTQFFKLSENLIILYFFFYPVTGFTVFDWKLKQIINTSMRRHCFVNQINGRIYHPKDEYSINKNIKNVKYLYNNFFWSIELFSAYQSELLKKIRDKRGLGLYCSTLIKGHNGRYLFNVSQHSKSEYYLQGEIIDTYTNQIIFTLPKNISAELEGSLFNFGDYLIILFYKFLILKVNHDKFPKADDEDFNINYIYKYNEYYPI